MRNVMKYFVLMAVLGILFSLVPQANAGTIVSSSVSTRVPPATGINPATGFPTWYQDSNGVRLGLCDNPRFCVIDPTGAEKFYFGAVARGSTQGGSRIVVSLSLEGSYITATGLPVPGRETLFARVDILAQGLPAAGVYTVKHPWGQRTFNVVADKLGHFTITQKAGRTQVGGGAVHSWAAPLNKAAWGPFFATAGHPVGFLGNSNALAVPRRAPLVPGMFTNIMTINGPLGNVITQPLWMVQGKIVK